MQVKSALCSSLSFSRGRQQKGEWQMIEQLQDWIEKYRAALLETRPDKLSERIQEASMAIKVRERELQTKKVNAADWQVLEDARNTLNSRLTSWVSLPNPYSSSLRRLAVNESVSRLDVMSSKPIRSPPAASSWTSMDWASSPMKSTWLPRNWRADW